MYTYTHSHRHEAAYIVPEAASCICGLQNIAAVVGACLSCFWVGFKLCLRVSVRADGHQHWKGHAEQPQSESDSVIHSHCDSDSSVSGACVNVAAIECDTRVSTYKYASRSSVAPRDVLDSVPADTLSMFCSPKRHSEDSSAANESTHPATAVSATSIPADESLPLQSHLL